jgi:hypothetical protein
MASAGRENMGDTMAQDGAESGNSHTGSGAEAPHKVSIPCGSGAVTVRQYLLRQRRYAFVDINEFKFLTSSL